MKTILLYILTLLLCSCSLVDRMAMKSVSRQLEKSQDALYLESSYDQFKVSALSQIKLLEALWYGDQENLGLLRLLVKSHASYGFGILETELLRDKLSRNKRLKNREDVHYYYNKALEYGEKYFEKKGLSLKEMIRSRSLQDLLSDHFSLEDAPALFFFSMALGGEFNLDKSNIKLLSYVRLISDFNNWVCKQDPKFENGLCDVFTAVFDVARPNMLGGNKKRGRTLFKKMMKVHPRHYFLRIAYMQFDLIPSLEEEIFYKQMRVLSAGYMDFKKISNWTRKSKVKNKFDTKFNLFNAIAFERYQIFKKYKKRIFD